MINVYKKRKKINIKREIDGIDLAVLIAVLKSLQLLMRKILVIY